ncbi:MAG TPA: glycosyltransferase [Solirubrobacteraceae bacterium]
MRRRSIAILVDAFPAPTETFVAAEAAALRALGHAVRVEARERAGGAGAPGVPIAYAFEDATARRAAALAPLVARDPLGAAADVAARRRWAGEEAVMPLRALAPVATRLRRAGSAHLHAHFLTGPALDAIRLGRLLGLTTSVIGHGFDVFERPRNLAAKLAAADLVLAPCAYTARHLERVCGRRVEVVVMGVDAARFSRRTAYPGGRAVVAVGRLVEKKGFDVLLEAAARVRLDSLTVVGDGPLRGALEAQARALRIDVTFTGALPPDGVRAVLERADLLAAPCVIAADGDRDAMPVVVKEALAMEVPVVASDAVGLPEIVDDRWGRLVAPGDPRALAAGIEAVLSLPAEARAVMGAAGREHVLLHANRLTEAARLSDLIATL